MLDCSVALIGDYDAGVVAHSTIPLALQLAGEEHEISISVSWLLTKGLSSISERSLAEYAGFWCVPGSPYQDMHGALRAIRFAREQGRPFLGTCGGFQHAVIEYARSVLGLAGADHKESNPDAKVALITPLACRLAETTGKLILKVGTRTAKIYRKNVIEELFNCGFGFNREFATLFEDCPMCIAGVDEHGEIRVIELRDHPFFIATQYQPERSALGAKHPLIAAFAGAVSEFATVARTSSTFLT